jgi:hypothetical protein
LSGDEADFNVFGLQQPNFRRECPERRLDIPNFGVHSDMLITHAFKLFTAIE